MGLNFGERSEKDDFTFACKVLKEDGHRRNLVLYFDFAQKGDALDKL